MCSSLYLSGHGRAIAGSGPGNGCPLLPQNLDLAGWAGYPSTTPLAQTALEGWAVQDPRVEKRGGARRLRIRGFRGAARRQPRHGNADRAIRVCDGPQHHLCDRQRASAAYGGRQPHHGVLTLAMLEAMNRQEGAGGGAGDLAWCSGPYVSSRVIEISRQNFGIVQMPKTDLKDDFTLGLQQVGVEARQRPACKMSGEAAPLHITKRAADVREKPASDAAVGRCR